MITTILLCVLALSVSAETPIKCVNFYGLETERKAPVCNWQHEPKWYLQKLQAAYGLNTVRLPYSREYAIGNDFKQMDLMIDTCNELGIKVILDYHRTYASHQGKTPSEGVTLGQFLDTHVGLLNRYQNKIWGVSVFNELQVFDNNYANHINHFVANAIESVFPGRYFYFMGCSGWGHDCGGITIPVGFENRTYIDIHQYAFTDNQTTRSTRFSPSVPIDRYFVGEIGAKTEDVPWLDGYLKFLEQTGVSNLCFWTISHSTDTGGLWRDDCESPEYEKLNLLARFFNHSNYENGPCGPRVGGRTLRGGSYGF